MAKRDTTVGAHFKPSLGRVVGTYTRQQEVSDGGGGAVSQRSKSTLLGLADEAAEVEVLPQQITSFEARQRHLTAESAAKQAHRQAVADREVYQGFLDDPAVKIGAGATGVAFSAMFAIAGLPIVIAPIAIATGASISASWVRPRWRAWRARREAAKKYESEPSRKDYLREANRMVGRYPHVNGDADRYESQPEIFVDYQGFAHEVSSSVDEQGVAEVKWSWLPPAAQGENPPMQEGSYIVYPHVNLEGLKIGQPMKIPGVNARGANFSRSLLAYGSVLDGADLRDANLSGCKWEGVSFRNVNLGGADVTGAFLPSDLTETNITREQFDSLAELPESGVTPYRVREVSVDDVVAVYGGDRDAAAIALWSGDVEVRSRTTNKVVTGEFDPDEHYIPAWALAPTHQ